MNKELIVLVGLVGSGKSTYCKENFYGNAVRINQDSLGNRETCLKLAEACMQSGMPLVIDRTNINAFQRSKWLLLAEKYGYESYCYYFDTPVGVCEERVIARKEHETIKENMSTEKKLMIVQDFVKSFQMPKVSEGFISVTTIKYEK